MSDARRKERKRLKREKKRNEIRRLQNTSAYQRLSQGEVIDCRINRDWRERGQASGFVLRRGPGGKLGMSAFMVDLWCAGLKDIWGKLDVFREDYDRVVERMDEQLEGTMEPCSLEELAGVLAGGIRFAQRNNFRLPPHFQRWATLFGHVDPANADLTHFGIEEGKLHWVGPLYDLQRRYLGRAEDFLAREDVEYTIGIEEESFGEYDADEDDDDDDEEEDDDDDDDDRLLDEQQMELSDRLGETIDNMSDSVAHWCRAKNLIPSSLISSAIAMKLRRAFMALAHVDPAEIEEFDRWLADARQNLSIEDRAETVRAEKQVDQFFEEIKKGMEPQGEATGAPASPPEAETLPG